MSNIKRNFLKFLLLPLTICTLLDAKESNCVHKEQANRKIKGCYINSSIKEVDAHSKILNRLQELSAQESKKSISKENSIAEIEKLVYAAGALNLTKNEKKVIQLDKELQSTKKNHHIEIINKLVYRKKDIALTKEEIQLTQVDREVNISKHQKIKKIIKDIHKASNSSVIKSTKNFLLIKVQKGDTLQSLAKDHYGDKNKYRLIYKENKDKIGKNLKIFSNTVLLIPNIKRGGKNIDS